MAAKTKTAKKGTDGFKSTECPISRRDFKAGANPIAVKIGDNSVILDPREFSTGSFGWFYNGKTLVDVDGKPVKVQCNLTVTVIGSKEVE